MFMESKEFFWVQVAISTSFSSRPCWLQTSGDATFDWSLVLKAIGWRHWINKISTFNKGFSLYANQIGRYTTEIVWENVRFFRIVGSRESTSFRSLKKLCCSFLKSSFEEIRIEPVVNAEDDVLICDVSTTPIDNWVLKVHVLTEEQWSYRTLECS